MSETPDSPESIESSDAPAPETPEKPSSDLQFDRAEVPVAKRCRMCNQPIGETFFRIEGKTICAPCQEKVNAQLTGGSGTERFLKASLYGTLAAVLGAGVYYAILAATGYELALISIGIGIIVGMAVKKGCGGRGGWVYQTLAIFLTYSAIASAYVPIVFGEFMKHRADKPAAHTATKATEVKPAASDAESETEAETPEPATTAPKPHMNIFLRSSCWPDFCSRCRSSRGFIASSACLSSASGCTRRGRSTSVSC